MSAGCPVTPAAPTPPLPPLPAPPGPPTPPLLPLALLPMLPLALIDPANVRLPLDRIATGRLPYPPVTVITAPAFTVRLSNRNTATPNSLTVPEKPPNVGGVAPVSIVYDPAAIVCVPSEGKSSGLSGSA